MVDSKRVYIVHAIDTEGPLYESLSATSARLRDVFNIDIDLTPESLKQIQKGQLDLGGVEEYVSKVFSPELIDYLDTWDKVDSMLSKALSAEFRNKLLDSDGGGWIYNWHCVDHVGFEYNPRRRDMGYHSIFDHYVELCSRPDSVDDGIHFHHHPVGFHRMAHKSATNYLSDNPLIYQIIARRIIV